MVQAVRTGATSGSRRSTCGATEVTGHVLILAVITGWLVEIARGHSGNSYQWLGALAGLTYVLAVVFFRFRG